MDLSIIIVNYNTKDLLASCIDSILKSNPKVSFEIIVVDNASTDGSAQWLEKAQGGKIRSILHKKNLGFSKANNSGIKKAVGQYILLLNSDTHVKRGAIDTLVEFAKHTPGTGAVGSKLLNPDGTTQSSVFRLPDLTRTIKQYWLGKKHLLDKYAPHGDKPSLVESVVGAAMLITPRARKEAGLLDERYFMYFEDLDYCRKLSNVGLKVYYLPGSEVYHLHGASGGKSDYLVASSKIYHGFFKYFLIWFVIWTSQKVLKS
jgi:GT2 family glycosyltransferase